MWKYVSAIAVCISFVASPALGALFSTSLPADFPTPNQWPNPTNPPQEGDLWTIGNLVYPDSFQDFANNTDPASITGGSEIIGWGAGWLGGQTDQNQVGPTEPFNDDVWTDLGDLYIVPTSGRVTTVPDPTFNMEAQMFTPPHAGKYRIQGRFFGLATGNVPLSEFGLFNEGPVKIIRGEHDHSNGQADYLHEVLHDDWINGSVAGGTRVELGPHPESFFDVTVELTEGMPIIFAEGTVDVNTDIAGEDWNLMRFGLEVNIDQIPEPSTLLLAFGGGLFLVGFAIRRR